MLDGALELGRAAALDVAQVGLALGALDRAPADGADGGRDVDRPVPLGVGRDGPDDGRDHVAGPLDHDVVADADVARRDVVGVVERRARDRDAADLDRLQDRERLDDARPPHVVLDVEQTRRRLARRELEGDGPARLGRAEAQHVLVVEPVDLDDDPVDLVVEAVAVGGPPVQNATKSSTSVNVRRWPSVTKPTASSRSSTADWRSGRSPSTGRRRRRRTRARATP